MAKLPKGPPRFIPNPDYQPPDEKGAQNILIRWNDKYPAGPTIERLRAVAPYGQVNSLMRDALRVGCEQLLRDLGHEIPPPRKVDKSESDATPQPAAPKAPPVVAPSPRPMTKASSSALSALGDGFTGKPSP
jgi:hypothetical protein